ncbi:P-loop containing nucleoside triphosphate hydrolases superfamily protein [Prunus dulcis]|uniref:P-loop containing nucleoside triphosphate hydrolases superfamily protein n=1 Tax=Prunus dulcis TaxID=3755 RepID=A0A4Y1RQ25_PRUDU|nr:P-loop containing nucleoside triphosphate hydrolases superfamily protein [Prunus dulcis]
MKKPSTLDSWKYLETKCTVEDWRLAGLKALAFLNSRQVEAQHTDWELEGNLGKQRYTHTAAATKQTVFSLVWLLGLGHNSMEASENCCVKVALHIRPLIDDERLQGCKECVTVTPGKPQIKIGPHSFTFDHVYGSGGGPSPAIFEDCISPLIHGLFQGYNATVLAYDRIWKDIYHGNWLWRWLPDGLIPQVMNALFNKIEILKDQTEFQMQVSYIEILNEEVCDLLDSLSMKMETTNGHAAKVGRHPIQIREKSNGAITLAGLTEVAVNSLQEMATCLDQGSLNRATGSTNMNNQSSRSHAIFTITLEQMRKIRSAFPGNDTPDEDMGEEYFCAKLHLVDLAGSERAKRTGSDGLRLKEGIHINKGLLALGNVISALGDEKKRKEGVHVPYRDSKLTRLLQDSLGGNSKTVMIACISPADINAEESLNTLKYANRARNIQNKPIVNRDVISNEMQKMQEQLKLLQAELCARGGAPSDEVLERIAWLEATNENLCRELHGYRSRCAVVQQCETDVQEGPVCFPKSDGLKRGFQSMDSSDYQMGEITSGENSKEIDEVKKEWEHQLLQNTMDIELNELNKRLEQKESEMRLFGGIDTEALKQHFGKKVLELEEEKRIVQQERDRLLAEVESLATNSDIQGQKMQDVHAQKLKFLETQILDLKKKQENQVHLLKAKQKSEEAAKRLQAEIQYIKAQKVQLQHKIKQEAEQFRQWKASREKELLQLRKEGRRNEYERHKLEALNQRQKTVLQRKTEVAATATKRLKELLEARKSASNERSLQRWLDHELEVMVHMYEVRFEYEKQKQVRAALEKELALLKQADQLSSEGQSTQRGKSGYSRVLSMSLDARMARIASLENMLGMSSNVLVVMASQLSEAEERERSLSGRGRWNQLRSMGDAKNLLQYIFNAAAEARCQLWEKNMEIKDMQDQLNELVTLLRKSEAQRKELVKEQKVTEQAVAVASSTSALVRPPAKHVMGNSRTSLKHCVDDISGRLSPRSLPAPKQLKFTPGIVSGSIQESATFLNQTRKMVPIGQLSMKKLATVGQGGKLWRWKRSHHQWLLQFKWKWQKPWRLSEWIKHSDETIIRSRPRPQAQIDIM